jgi:hypothetical protein
MVLAHHGRESSIDDIRGRLGTSRDGTTGYELARVARELGMEARGFRVEDPEALAQVALPAIAHYVRGHFVVIERVRPGSRVRVVDPLRGRLDLGWSAFWGEFSGVLVAFRKTAAFRPARDRSWLAFLAAAARSRVPLVARLVALALVLQAMALALPGGLAFVVDRVIPARSTTILGLIASGVPALIAGYTLVAWLRGRATAWLVRDTSRELLDRVFRHLLTLPLPYFHGRPVEDLVIRLQGADLVLDELLDQVMAAVLDTLMAVAALIALFALYPQMSALVLGAAALQGALTWLAHRLSLDDFVRDILAGSRLYQFAAAHRAELARDAGRAPRRTPATPAERRVLGGPAGRGADGGAALGAGGRRAPRDPRPRHARRGGRLLFAGRRLSRSGVHAGGERVPFSQHRRVPPASLRDPDRASGAQRRCPLGRGGPGIDRVARRLVPVRANVGVRAS